MAKKNEVAQAFNATAVVIQDLKKVEQDIEKKNVTASEYIKNLKTKVSVLTSFHCQITFDGFNTGNWCVSFYSKDVDELRRVEAELAKLPAEEELRKRGEEERRIRKAIDDVEKKIGAVNTFLNENDDIETLQQKIRDTVQSIEKLQAEKRANESKAEEQTPKMPVPKPKPKPVKTRKVILIKANRIYS